MPAQSNLTKELIAPCGINCSICKAYLRAENKCPGCNAGRKVGGKPIKCARRLCKKRKGEFCFDCDEFPCDSIKRLDKRYREKYAMSVIENLKSIRDKGMDKFLAEQEKKYCNGNCIKCVHDGKYYKKPEAI